MGAIQGREPQGEPQWRSVCWGRDGCENHRGGHGRAPGMRRYLAYDMSSKDDCDFRLSSSAVGLLSWLRDFEMLLLSAKE